MCKCVSEEARTSFKVSGQLHGAPQKLLKAMIFDYKSAPFSWDNDFVFPFVSEKWSCYLATGLQTPDFGVLYINSAADK